MLRRKLSKSLSVLLLAGFLLVALIDFPGAVVRANHIYQLITEVSVLLNPASVNEEAPAAVPNFSDFVGIYALVDKVVMEPNDSAPERVQLWGAFATASERDRDSYNPPQRGYYYFSIPAGKEEVCRKEWADFKTVTGTGKVIGFGSRHGQKGRLRKADEKPASPDPYPVAWGLTQMSQRQTGYAPVRELRLLPAPHSPTEGAEVKSGRVTLISGNVADPERKNAKYIFEIKASGSTEQEISPPIAAGEKETRWSPNLIVKAGEKYTWRVKLSDGQSTGPAASSEFKGVR